MQKMERRFELQMNAVDARARGIADGDELRVYNGRGELRLRARVDDSVPAGGGCRLSGLGARRAGRQEHQRADQRPADRHGRRGDVLLGAGRGGKGVRAAA